MKKADYIPCVMPFILMLLTAWIISCSGRPGRSETPVAGTSSVPPEEQALKLISFDLPEENARFITGNQVRVVISPDVNGRQPDSVAIFFDGNRIAMLKSAPWEYSIPPGMTSGTGRKSVRAAGYRNGKAQTITRFAEFFSDIVPPVFGYRIVNSFPHDPDAFTQGLFYHNGLLYEGTGQEAGSTLREVELETGKVLRQLNLEASLFGEGITLYQDRIYQVTWQNKVGFVYDRETFRLLNKIYYSTEGWGLTTVNDRIAMSDGSNILWFFDPGLFTVVSRLEVYDHEKKVDQLNELEYINGEIWANIWMTDLIARIDPATGRVNSYVNLASLFPEHRRRETGADVLNGIAYDEEGKRLFVTGKRWPKLYEIRVIE